MEKNDKPSALVIMPFTQEYYDFFDNIILASMSEYLSIKRSGNLFDNNNLIKGIINDLENSEVIIAVLTSYNANVLYELGIAHAFLKNVVLLLDDNEKRIFDVCIYNHVMYSLEDVEQLKAKLRDIAISISKHEYISDSPISDFSVIAKSIRNIYEVKKMRDHIIEEINASISGKIAEGVFDFMVNITIAGEELGNIYGNMASSMSTLTEIISNNTAKINALNITGPNDYYKRINTIIDENIKALNEYAENMIVNAISAEKKRIEFVKIIKKFITTGEISTPGDIEELVKFKDVLNLEILVSRGLIDSIEEYNKALESNIGIKSAMDVAVRKAQKSHTDIIIDNHIMIKEFEGILEIIQEKYTI